MKTDEYGHLWAAGICVQCGAREDGFVPLECSRQFVDEDEDLALDQ